MAQVNAGRNGSANCPATKNNAAKCPKSGKPAHKDYRAASIPLNLAEQAWRDEIEARFRDGSLNRSARYWASRCNADADDLLSRAIVRALIKGSSGLPASIRLHGIMRSICSSYIRSAEREDSSLKQLFNQAGEYLSEHSCSLTNEPDCRILQSELREEIGVILKDIVRDDPDISRLLEGLAANMRGKALSQYLELSQNEIAALRRKMHRRANNIRKARPNDA